MVVTSVVTFTFPIGPFLGAPSSRYGPSVDWGVHQINRERNSCWLNKNNILFSYHSHHSQMILLILLTDIQCSAVNKSIQRRQQHNGN